MITDDTTPHTLPVKVLQQIRNTPSVIADIVDELVIALWENGMRYSSRENALAITKLEEASYWLDKDNTRRKNGTSNPYT